MMKPKVEGVRLFGRWSYGAVCPCGWSYFAAGAGSWELVLSVAVAHADMLERTHRR